MDPRGQQVEKFLKLKEARASLVALGIVSVVIGAFVVGAVVKAADVLTPPTAQFPDQGSLPPISGGGGASNLLEVLRGSKPPDAVVDGASYAKWSDFKDDTLIGGRLGLGQIQAVSVGGPLRIGYPLDIQIIHNSSEDPTQAEIAANSYINQNKTAVLRIASLGNNPAGKLWTGIQLSRMNATPDTTQVDPAFSEKWFIGMDDVSDHFIIRANGGNTDLTKRVNIVDIDPAKGAACIGGMFVGTTGAGQSDVKYDGNIGGYLVANTKCNSKLSGSHLCSEEEIFRTIACDATKLPSTGQVWINKGTPGATSKLTNDCNGWTDNATYFGGYWTFNVRGGNGGLASCKAPVDTLKKPLACCK